MLFPQILGQTRCEEEQKEYLRGILSNFAEEAMILLLDEPTSNLDINYQIEIMVLLRRLTSEEESRLSVRCII